MADDGIYVRINLTEYDPAKDVYMILDNLLEAYSMRYIKHA